MAKASTVRSTPLPPDVVGPTQSGYSGYDSTSAPDNPSTQIQQGRPLTVVGGQELTARRPFSEVTRNPLHYNDGHGTDENVTSRRTLPPLQTLLDGDIDHVEERPLPGVDNQPYSQGSNTATTLNGVRINGT